MENCYRYKDLIAGKDLEDLISDPKCRPNEKVGQAEIKKLQQKTDKLLNDPTVKTDQYDAKIFIHVYNTFSHLPEEITIDQRFWQHLCLNEFKDFVKGRWSNKKLPQHFLGTQSLGGSARNTMARLFRLGDIPRKNKKDFRLPKIAIQNQERWLQLGDLKIGLNAEIIQAVLEKHANSPDKVFREKMVLLNEIGGTRMISNMTVNEIKKLI